MRNFQTMEAHLFNINSRATRTHGNCTGKEEEAQVPVSCGIHRPKMISSWSDNIDTKEFISCLQPELGMNPSCALSNLSSTVGFSRGTRPWDSEISISVTQG
ncbi:hypothetical protein BC332_18618 [Capsicum chinense]|nr:hypothetical protein BC332_18618 [Capsicum chinense]